ncbi:MAG: hypothetical protein M3292_09680, partial [Actinomycetota bacterium]|nr:hypothetical protein [Actinomycetota bacterium]
MRTFLFILVTLALAGVAAGAGLAFSGSAGPTAADAAQSRATLTVRSSRYGRILFDSRGRALYAFTRDPRG